MTDLGPRADDEGPRALLTCGNTTPEGTTLMAITSTPATATSATTWLLRLRIGTIVAAVALVGLGATNVFWPLGDGAFTRTSDYLGTANALPLGVGLILSVIAFHRIHNGADGRRGAIGTWIYCLCSTEIVVQCLVSVAARTELIWGPAYPLCTIGSSVGLAFLAAGTWRVGLAPKWMLAIWPPLGVVGSWWGIGPIPVLYAGFLVALGVLASRRSAIWAAPTSASTEIAHEVPQ